MTAAFLMPCLSPCTFSQVPRPTCFWKLGNLTTCTKQSGSPTNTTSGNLPVSKHLGLALHNRPNLLAPPHPPEHTRILNPRRPFSTLNQPLENTIVLSSSWSSKIDWLPDFRGDKRRSRRSRRPRRRSARSRRSETSRISRAHAGYWCSGKWRFPFQIWPLEEVKILEMTTNWIKYIQILCS